MVALNPWQAVILGLTQGLTEFLPVSSSAHLVFVPELLGIPKPPLLFDVLLHLATGLAVVLYFRRDLTGLIIDGYKGQGEARKLLFAGAGLASAVILALAFSDFVKAAFGSPIYPAFLLLVTAAMLFSADYAKGQKEMAGLGAVGAFLVGIFQGFALLPGVSRSGSTITAACWWGSRQAAARFSFLVSILILGLESTKPSRLSEKRRRVSTVLIFGDDSGVYQRLFCYPLFPPLSWKDVCLLLVFTVSWPGCSCSSGS